MPLRESYIIMICRDCGAIGDQYSHFCDNPKCRSAYRLRLEPVRLVPEELIKKVEEEHASP